MAAALSHKHSDLKCICISSIILCHCKSCTGMKVYLETLIQRYHPTVLATDLDENKWFINTA